MKHKSRAGVRVIYHFMALHASSTAMPCGSFIASWDWFVKGSFPLHLFSMKLNVKSMFRFQSGGLTGEI